MSRAREASVPRHVREALEGIFGASLAGVRVIEHSRFARLHGRAVATTRRERIYLAGSAQQFFANPWLMLHEYCHVLKQWRSGTLSVRGYLIECLRHGYWNNRFEIEARAFADRHLPQLHAALSAKQRLAPVEPPGDPHQQHRE